LAFDLLQTPFDLQIGRDKDNDGIPDQFERDSIWYVNNLPDSLWDVDNDFVPDWRDGSENPQLGMTAFKRFTRGFEPTSDPERYMLLAGYWNDIYDPYDTIPSPPDDQRFLMSSGPFDLEPDSSVTFIFAVLLANWYGQYQTPDSGLAPVDKWAQLYYDMNWGNIPGVKEHSSKRIYTNISIQPNPIRKETQITFTLPKKSRISLKLYNALGQPVKRIEEIYSHAGKYTINLSTKELAQGTYFLILETPESKSSCSLIIVR
jgi:hypothetical protein